MKRVSWASGVLPLQNELSSLLMCFLTDDTPDQQLSSLLTLYGTNTVLAVQKLG